MAFSKKTRKRRIQRKKRRSKTRKMKGGLKMQSIENIYYEKLIPQYLPNLPETHESFKLLQNIIDKYIIKSRCALKNTFWKTYKFNDLLTRKYLKYHHDSNYVDRSTSHYRFAIGGGDSREEIAYEFSPLPQLVILGKTCKPDYKGNYSTLEENWVYNKYTYFSPKDTYLEKPLEFNLSEEQKFAWCLADFPPGWTCTSTAITEIKVRQEKKCGFVGYMERIEEIGPEELDPKYFHRNIMPYESNKITYLFQYNSKSEPTPKFEVNCVRYTGDVGYINFEVIDLTNTTTFDEVSSDPNV
jgi:hypothetical protein